MTILPIRAFHDNYIWCLIDSAESKCLVIDPGQAAPVLGFLQQNQLQLTHILITHHHFDHTDGIQELTHRFEAIVYGPRHETIPSVQFKVDESDQITIFNTRFKVLDIPGHTKGHIAYYGAGSVFCGDTLFTAGCGKIFEGTPPQMWDSLQKINSLPSETLIYCGHEYTLSNLKFALEVEPLNSAIQERYENVKSLQAQDKPTVPAPLSLERATNPFLRCQEATLIAAVEKKYAKKLRNSIEVFAHLREWKNNFS